MDFLLDGHGWSKPGRPENHHGSPQKKSRSSKEQENDLWSNTSLIRVFFSINHDKPFVFWCFTPPIKSFPNNKPPALVFWGFTMLNLSICGKPGDAGSYLFTKGPCHKPRKLKSCASSHVFPEHCQLSCTGGWACDHMRFARTWLIYIYIHIINIIYVYNMYIICI